MSAHFACKERITDFGMQAQQTNNPEDILPVFWDSEGCTKDSFPDTKKLLDCDSQKPENCLKIIDVKKWVNIFEKRDFDSFGDVSIESANINNIVERNKNQWFTKEGSTGVPLSFFIPVNYIAVFFSNLPINYPITLNDLLKPNNVEGGVQRYKIYQGNVIESAVYSDQVLIHNFDATGNVESQSMVTKGKTDTDFTLNSTYLILLKLMDLSDLITLSCLGSEFIQFGNTNLSDIWKPQTAPCDTRMTILCSHNNQSDPLWSQLCECVHEQNELDFKFGEGLSEGVTKCLWNPSAYLSKAMVRNSSKKPICKQNSTAGSDASDSCTAMFMKPKLNQAINNSDYFTRYDVVQSAVPGSLLYVLITLGVLWSLLFIYIVFV